jgi:hypothetical protein
MRGSLPLLLIFFQPKKKEMTKCKEQPEPHSLNTKKTKEHNTKTTKEAGNHRWDKVYDGKVITS